MSYTVCTINASGKAFIRAELEKRYKGFAEAADNGDRLVAYYVEQAEDHFNLIDAPCYFELKCTETVSGHTEVVELGESLYDTETYHDDEEEEEDEEYEEWEESENVEGPWFILIRK